MKTKQILFGTLGLALAFMVSCQSAKKAEETSPEAQTKIEDAPIAFDPMGSDSGRIDGLRSINFGYDQATLTEEAKGILAANAQWLNGKSNVNLQIEGHCDSRGSIEYNLSLGERRAQAVKNYMVGLGVSASRLTIISYGEEKPLDTAESESAWAKNRRANFVPIAQ